MCSQFLKRMDNFQGDLTDIIRATGGNPAAETDAALPDWQFPMNYSSCPAEYFGDPFTQLRDPLLLDVDNPVSEFFHASDGGAAGGFGGGSYMNFSHHSSSVEDDQMMKRPNFFSRMLQISPSTSTCESPAAAAGLKGPPPPPPPPMLVSNNHQSLISTHNSKSCLVESPALQISSPRNTGIRRRKSQAKKVVCIPAPAPANSRPSGEIVPSDLWAWRKYGQKPIKGSPYPRGYYRCSSSKGCSARKQVERSRTDPNMLVITYTSEHNHPWPTQRNALAGSTRSQPSKTTSNSSKQQRPTIPKDEEITTLTLPQEEANAATTVKEEMDQDFEETESDQGFPSSYKPTLPELPESNQSEDSFFADLGEIEGDSLDQLLLFDGRDSKDTTLDPFTFYDWGAGTTTTATSRGGATSYGEAKRATETNPLTKKGQPYTPSID